MRCSLTKNVDFIEFFLHIKFIIISYKMFSRVEKSLPFMYIVYALHFFLWYIKPCRIAVELYHYESGTTLAPPADFSLNFNHLFHFFYCGGQKLWRVKVSVRVDLEFFIDNEARFIITCTPHGFQVVTRTFKAALMNILEHNFGSKETLLHHLKILK